MITIQRVLVVCTGNICRSPMTEGLLQSRAEKAALRLSVTSAGVHALVGMAPDANAQAVMREAGYDISHLRGTQCDSANLMSADLVLAMDHFHIQWLHRHYPQVRGRVMLMGKWDDGKEVPDPYGQEIDNFRLIRDQLDGYCDLWCDWLSKIAG